MNSSSQQQPTDDGLFGLRQVVVPAPVAVHPTDPFAMAMNFSVIPASMSQKQQQQFRQSGDPPRGASTLRPDSTKAETRGAGLAKGKTKEQFKREMQMQKSGLNAQQLKAFNWVVFGQKNVHIAGAAGTGKSHLLTYIVKALKKLHVKVALTAYTGVAADNLNNSSASVEEKATTVHSWMGCGWSCSGTAEEEAEKIKNKDRAWRKWVETDVLIIDEISMVHPMLFVKIDKMAKILRNQYSLPFGGLQLVLCGDWFQLEPVEKEWDKYFERDPFPAGGFRPATAVGVSATAVGGTAVAAVSVTAAAVGVPSGTEGARYVQFCMETGAWKRAIPHDNVIILTENFRQKTDPVFQTLLDQIREGILTDDNEQLLNNRIDSPLTVKMPAGMKPTFLMSLDHRVKAENGNCLAAERGDVRSFAAKSENYNLDEATAKELVVKLMKEHRIQDTIQLKIDAPVMLLVNLSVERGFVNGMQGVVTAFDPDDGYPVIKFVNGSELKIKQFSWFKRAEWKKQSMQSLKYGVTVEQLPIVLSYAVTIHKVQSLTLTAVKIDLGNEIFAGGQAYVALSRPRSLDGLCLSAFNRNSIKINPRVIKFYDKYRAYYNRVIEEDDEEAGGAQEGVPEGGPEGSYMAGIKDAVIECLDSMHFANASIMSGRQGASLKRPRKRTNSDVAPADQTSKAGETSTNHQAVNCSTKKSKHGANITAATNQTDNKTVFRICPL